ncbi:hypothetical protein [Longimicrobium sp.]|uniref:hypothetical protein n=1 Tax=Longimicrobium sp. TaxID=2029185 RepID=UPI002E34FBB1|nr:hypothetical protein [Longimicrobium sp.]HEX6036603.1 hypothetical protein [Longimicrobium sp.]
MQQPVTPFDNVPGLEPAPADGRWTPGAIAVMAFGGTLALNILHVPGVTVSQWIPVFLLATGCMAAVRWKRAGVRNELRNQASAKIAEFGGGVYGAIAMATWLQLEIGDFVGDVVAAGSIGDFVGSLSLGWMISQAVSSIKFALQAGLWPWHWFSSYGMQTVLIAAGVACGLDWLLKVASPRYASMRAEQEKIAAA